MDRNGKPGWAGKKKDAKAFMAHRGELLSELQERLFAHGRTGGDRSVLLVIQGLDTAGKGGIVRHVLGMVDPQGVALRAFGVPTEEELRHHFLWRVRRALPPAGRIGVFDRSHYEDVLVAPVEGLAPRTVVEKRFEEINR
ncbi:polyphosphate kinase 2 family protein, partial [Georgenia sp. 10Sc9-8]|nr:polyphosphate kinase 2 family protein [Georgenia halotolerans]